MSLFTSIQNQIIQDYYQDMFGEVYSHIYGIVFKWQIRKSTSLHPIQNDSQCIPYSSIQGYVKPNKQFTVSMLYTSP
jgi:hypothetical protein